MRIANLGGFCAITVPGTIKFPLQKSYLAYNKRYELTSVPGTALSKKALFTMYSTYIAIELVNIASIIL